MPTSLQPFQQDWQSQCSAEAGEPPRNQDLLQGPFCFIMQIQTNIEHQHQKNNLMFKERPATSSLDQLVNPGSPPFIQSGAQQRVITGVPPVSTLIKTICSGGNNKKIYVFTIWLTLRSRLDQSYLERESVKMSSWTFFFAKMECVYIGDYFW